MVFFNFDAEIDGCIPLMAAQKANRQRKLLMAHRVESGRASH
jgi:hypothetical protein